LRTNLKLKTKHLATEQSSTTLEYPQSPLLNKMLHLVSTKSFLSPKAVPMS